jgi:hypothetical protein
MSEPTPAASAAPAEPQQPATPAPPAQPAPTPQPPAAPPGTDEPWADPAKAKAEIEKLRREAGAARTNAKQQAADDARTELAQTIGKALGLVQGDEAPTPERLTQTLSSTTDELRLTKVELAVFRAAPTHQGDANALLDSRTFLAKVADLDPASADFQTQVDAAIRQAVTDNPKLKAVQATGASAVDHAGGSGEGAISPEQFAAMKPAEKNALYVSNPTLYRQLAGR